MKIEANNEIDTNLFALGVSIHQITMDQVLDKFPDAEMQGYKDHEKGYDGIEAGFSTPEGDFYLYSRYGNLRLGCKNGWYNPMAKVWKEELLKTLQG